jgi:hypothetical protein
MLHRIGMKKFGFQADPSKGFIASFITPVSAKPPHQFTLVNAMVMGSLTFGFFWVVRLFLAH